MTCQLCDGLGLPKSGCLVQLEQGFQSRFVLRRDAEQYSRAATRAQKESISVVKSSIQSLHHLKVFSDTCLLADSLGFSKLFVKG